MPVIIIIIIIIITQSIESNVLSYSVNFSFVIVETLYKVHV